MAAAAVGLVVVAAVALFFQRRAHHVLFIPDAPSRSMDTSPWVEARPVEQVRVLFVGHSLIGEEMPRMARDIAVSLGVEWSHDFQLVDGGSLRVNWDEPELASGVDAATALATGGYDAIVLTEAVNLDDHLRWSQPADYAARYYGLARQHRPDIRLFFYETWHHREEPRLLFGFASSRSWREFLDHDLGKWEHIVDGAREQLEGEPAIDIVAGGQSMAALSDAIAAGRVPGYSSLDALFADGVHLGPAGHYFIALVHVATLTRRSPVGAPNEVEGVAGRVNVPAETAAALQEIAWRAVRGYPRSGVLGPAGD